jgi:hypothetical protein
MSSGHTTDRYRCLPRNWLRDYSQVSIAHVFIYLLVAYPVLEGRGYCRLEESPTPGLHQRRIQSIFTEISVAT